MKKINIINKPTSSWLEPIEDKTSVLSWQEKDFPIKVWDKDTGCVGNKISYDIETELIDKENPKHNPRIVLAVAFNGDTLYRIAAKDLKDFVEVHRNSRFICHNAAFDILHTSTHIGDLTFKYETAEEERVLDTYILGGLVNLAKHGECKPIKGKYSLAGLVKDRLNLELPKEVEVHGETVRFSYGNFLGKNLDIIPAAYWYYCCWDTLSTFFLWQKLEQEAQDLAKKNDVDPKQLLSHFIQVKAQIALNLLNREGIGLDQAKVSESKIKLEEKIIRLDKELKHEFDYVGGVGKRERFSAVALKIEKEYNVDLPTIIHKCTGKEIFSQSKVLLQEFSHIPFFKKYIDREHTNKLLKTFVTSLIGQNETFPRYNILMSTGRTSCTGGKNSINIQQTPRPDKDIDLRSMFRAPEGSVYVLTDMSQAELVCISQVMTDFGFGSRMGQLINNNEDIHLSTAKAIDPKVDPGSIRTLSKAASFGFLGGMGVKSFKTYAESYGLKLEETDVKAIKRRWLAAYPEFVKFFSLHSKSLSKILIVEDEVPKNIPLKYALTTFFRICEGYQTSKNGYVYTKEEKSWIFDRLTTLTEKYTRLKRYEEEILRQDGSIFLLRGVRGLVTGVVKRSGRLRGNTSFCDYNNNYFQGLLADCMLTGLFKLFRESESTGLFKIRAFIHDETVCEVKEENKEKAKEVIERILLSQAKKFCPDVNMKAESEFSQCWKK